ncbi:neutral/alkaline nonlysosomal ceramidase-like protein [Amylocarpus encephaloides]|uniref:Neutral ceramidase n=1 Tax=Amylocarpus encephaloides TaxID=45428 RepID=A0A9P7Y5X6_9HELO|nr:neutral/alkaline nonlysosomal ceramidase-like protein [Amylocarpus encephaloides]
MHSSRANYSVLPVEEHEGDNHLENPVKFPKRALGLIVLLITTLSFGLAFLILGGSVAVSPTIETENGQYSNAFRDHLTLTRAQGDEYFLGVGKADITGPVVELNFMGYANLAQIGTGLRQRIYARSFIVGNKAKPADRFVYMVIDTSNGDTAIRNGIIEGIAALGSAYSMYTTENIAVTGTHSHAGPGGWLNYLLPQITSLGFSQQSYQAIVDGSVLSIKRAHDSLTAGHLSFADTTVADANINRSLWAYLANPASERARYTDDVDKTISMLRFQRSDTGKNMGVLAWHSVHGTSLLGNNTHVAGGKYPYSSRNDSAYVFVDNKGVSSYLFEKAMLNDASAAPGFVAAFSQSSVGDTSPNVLGAWCDDGTGTMCTLENSTCGGTSQACHGRGPAFQKVDLGVSSCYEIGKRVYNAAKALYDSFDLVATPVQDASVKAYHTFNNMSFYEFPSNGKTLKTCPAGLGYGFAAGTTDWPGAFDFTQDNNDTNSQNPLWVIVSSVLKAPSPEQKSCQSPKPVLLDVGELNTPYAWSPNIIDVQSFRVGQFVIIVSPSEATTMAGRRWKDAVAAAAKSITTTTPKVVLGGPANTYAHYVSTPEEYGIQRYEGASTLYGQNELAAYIYLSESNMKYLASDAATKPPAGPTPPDNRKNSLNLMTGVVYDNPPLFKKFGDVITEPTTSYAHGAVINATFVGANPRNNLRLEGTFTAVEMVVNGKWAPVRDDGDWFLVYTWERKDGLLGSSHVIVSWETESYAVPGTYRIRYNGDSKTPVTGTIVPFSAVSRNFTLS